MPVLSPGSRRQPGQASLNDRSSCRECQRRRAKCDGAIPVCSTCRKYSRHCLYDRHSRTPLTRKHLTAVEERLQRAEALLRHMYTDDHLTRLLDYPSTNLSGVTAEVGVASGSTDTPESFGGHGSSSSYLDTCGGDSLHTLSEGGHDEGLTTANQGGLELGFLGSLPVLDSDFTRKNRPSLDQPPSATDDFEWNEQDHAWLDLAAHDQTSPVHSPESNVNKVRDGMAALAVDDSSSGYLGITSGAALLRLTWMNGEGAEWDQQTRDRRRESLLDLFRSEASEGPSPSAWLRTQPLLTRTLVENYVDAYFKLYHPTFPILHEPTFRSEYAREAPRPGGGVWHVLANLVVAMGAFVSSTCSDGTDATIFRGVKDGLSVESLESGSLALVQIFALAANYLQKRNKPNSGSNYAGIALRLAIGLGLHKEFEDWKTSPLRKEIRRRVWWLLCILDVGATVTYGRPLTWPQAGVEAALPANIHESDLTSESESMPPSVNEMTIYTYVRIQASYHLRTMKIYNRLITRPSPSVEELISLDEEAIGAWLRELPPYFEDNDVLISNSELALAHAISRWRYRNLRTLMYRPFVIQWAENPESAETGFNPSEQLARDRCFLAAKETITSIDLYWKQNSHTRLAAWYVLYFLFQVTLIPLHCLRRNPGHGLAFSWRDQIRTALNVAKDMSDVNPSSSMCYNLIIRLCGSNLNDGHATSGKDKTFDDLNLPTAQDWSWTPDIGSGLDTFDLWSNQMNTGQYAWGGGNFGDWNTDFGF